MTLKHPDNPNVSLHWPVPLLIKRLDNAAQVNKELVELFNQHRDKHGKPGTNSYASADDLHKQYENHKAFMQLAQFIMGGVFEIASTINGPYWQKMNVEDIKINLSGIWFQITNEYNFHEVHVHGNCSWSGVYYVQSGDAGSKAPGFPNGITRFYGPHLDIQGGGHLDLGSFYLQDVSHDSVPEDGKLVVFPSHLKHMPYPYVGDKDRIIVSFHAQVNGDKPLKLGYKFN